jgi:hypothetical protein
VPDEDVRVFFDCEFSESRRRVEAFWTLKNVAGHVLERLVLLDRQAATPGARLMRVFDPGKSPRCVCVFASKQEHVLCALMGI